MSDGLRSEYVDARCVLLDALVGLRPHLDAFVLIGAQAVYVRTVDRLPGYQPFTTDADLVFDPARLADEPLLVDAMTTAGFVYSGKPGIWHCTVSHADRPDHVVPVDLIVPKEIASTTGRRGARLPGGHGKTAAQKTEGVEGTLVDNDLIEIGALDKDDIRVVSVAVAGPAALIVAKAFNLGERLDNPRRLLPKDAGDVFRLYEANSVKSLLERFERVASDERSAEVTRTAMGYLRTLFATPRSPGIGLASTALGDRAAEYDVAEIMADYTQELLRAIED
ncbi:hypothetical protein [Ilumatobacter sp.]|uniref:hypothetical protein n=1 Tax=Ilumatobacter sp. TaxID=1967498 RepID=UPI003750B821